MKQTTDRRLLLLAGTMANAARDLVGGQGLNFRHRAATILTLSERAATLLKAVDEYDNAIIEAAREKNERAGK